MKKKIFTICIAIITVFVCVFMAACTARESFEVKETSLREGGKSTAQLVKEICEKYPDRTMGTGNDNAFLSFISSEMASYGYPSANFDDGEEGSQGSVPLAASAFQATVEINEFRFENYYSKAIEKGYNLVYRIPASTETTDNVLLLAAYDNCTSLKVSSTDMGTGQTSASAIGGEGAYSSATGVATLLRVAYELADKELPYNLTIAFVDCSENAWEGATEVATKYFVNKEGNFICLNFSRLGGGDYTYIYSDENSQPYNDYFYSVADKTDKNGVFKDIPFNKQIADVKFIEEQKTEYSHYAMYGNNLIFNTLGLAVASYVSFNWSSFENPFYTECAGYSNLLGTAADTYANMIERLGGEGKGEEVLESRLDAVVLNAVTAVSAENSSTLFGAVEKSDPSKTSDYASSSKYVPLIMKIVIIIAFVGVAIYFTTKGRSVLAKKQREKIQRMQSEAMGGPSVAPKAEDIFQMGDDFTEKKDDGKGKGDGPSSGSSDGGDSGDIFEGF